MAQENREQVLRLYLLRAAGASGYHIKVLMAALVKLVDAHVITARMLCDKVLMCEKLDFEHRTFWIESFRLIKRVIVQVDYKGVREIMKVCRDKAQWFPLNVNVTYMPQLLAVEDILRFIFDRNNCLLPAYFIANEIMRPFPYHWKLNRLMTDFVEEFRTTAQMVSIIGHASMLPIVEHFGYADHMMNSWRLDHNTLKFNFKGSLPYEPELLEEQKPLLRYVLEQPYSREMVSQMLNLQKHQKQRYNALEEQLVNLIVQAMEMTEANDATAGSGFNSSDEQITPYEWMWLHLSSQLIYFVLFQFVSFMHIVLALHEKVGPWWMKLIFLVINYFSPIAFQVGASQGSRSTYVDSVAVYIRKHTEKSCKILFST